MPRAPLTAALDWAVTQNTYAMGFVCLGWSDAQAYVTASAALGIPVILQVGPGARTHMPLSAWGPMLCTLADDAEIPVVVHLDHGRTPEECETALAHGFTSVMFDGSALPLRENIAATQAVSKAARARDAGVEAELGFVGYAGGAGSGPTQPEEVVAFAAEVDIDALAVSIGNVHLQTAQMAEIDWARAACLRDVTETPLVIHGGSGVTHGDRRRLAREFGVRKVNVGTELRQAYGAAMRAVLAEDPELFDRLKIDAGVAARMVRASRTLLEQTLS